MILEQLDIRDKPRFLRNLQNGLAAKVAVTTNDNGENVLHMSKRKISPSSRE